MDGYRAESDAKMAAEDARQRDEHGRFLPADGKPEPVAEMTEPTEPTAESEPPRSVISFEVATAARAGGLPQEWIDKAPADDLVILALQGLRARAESGQRQPAPGSQPPIPALTKLELAFTDAQGEALLAPELAEPLKKIMAHVNARDEAYEAKIKRVEDAYGALEGAYGQLRASTAQQQARQEATVLDGWSTENPKLTAILGNATEALAQLDQNGFPTTEKAFRWRQLAQKVNEMSPGLRLDNPASRGAMTKAAQKLWPEAFQGVPERNGKGSLPPGASIRPAAKGDESRPRSAEEAELRRLQEAFAEVGARDAQDWFVKTGGKPLPV